MRRRVVCVKASKPLEPRPSVLGNLHGTSSPLPNRALLPPQNTRQAALRPSQCLEALPQVGGAHAPFPLAISMARLATARLT